jgi:hypothetical protein
MKTISRRSFKCACPNFPLTFGAKFVLLRISSIMVVNAIHKLSLGTFGVSVLAHATLFFIVSGWVLIQAVVPTAMDDSYASQQMLEAPPESPEEDVALAALANDPTEPVETTVMQTGMPTDVITAARPSNFNLPSSVGVYVPSAAVNTSPTPTSSKSSDGIKKITVGQIFGQKVEATRLGVILDISGSAHPFLVKAFTDIDRSFKDAVIVFALGCGMRDDFKQKIRVSDFSTANILGKESTLPLLHTLSQIRNAIRKNSDIGHTFERAQKRENVYYVDGGGIFATQYAFDELIKQDVDTIYWFADFEDPIFDAPVTKLLHDLKDRNIKVYINNFSEGAKSIGMKFASQLARETGGTTTVKKR